MSNTNLQHLLNEYAKKELMVQIMGDSIDRGIGRPGVLERVFDVLIGNEDPVRRTHQELRTYEEQARQLRLEIKKHAGGEEAIAKTDWEIAKHLDSLRKQGY